MIARVCLLLGLAFLSRQIDSPRLWAAQADPAQQPQGRPTAEAALDGIPADFVPVQPQTQAERDRQEVLGLYMAARALEDQRRPREALTLFAKALEKSPSDPTILRRMCRLSLAIGRVDQAIDYGTRALEASPDDSNTLGVLVTTLLERRADRDAAELLLRRVIGNPRLDANAPARLIALRMFGDFMLELRNNPEEAAAAYEHIVSALEERAAARMKGVERERILRGGEAESYLRFGQVLLRSKRYEKAVLALRRGLLYDASQPQLLTSLAEALLEMGQVDEADRVLDGFLRKQPQGREPYELLGRILAAKGQTESFLPRIEAAAKADSKNLALQFLLADTYRQAGRNAEAEALLKTLVKTQGDIQAYGPLVSMLTRERRAAELVTILGEAVALPGGLQAIAPQLQAIVSDTELIDAMLAQGLAWAKNEPQKLAEPARRVLTFLANEANRPEPLLELDRIITDREPTPQHYREFFSDLYRHRRYAEAAATLQKMLSEHPDERSPVLLGGLARAQLLMGETERALETARQAETLDPNDKETLFLLGHLLGQLGRNDEAVALYTRVIEANRDNPEIELRGRAGLSAIYANLEDYAKASAELEILLEKYPDDPDLNNDLGYLWADQGKNLEKAEQMIRKALDEEPENVSFLDSLGWVLFRLNKPEEAIEPLEKAARDPGASATILDHLGDVYFALKRFDDAEAAWNKAEALAQRSKPPDRRLESIQKKRAELARLREAEAPTRPDDP